MDKNKKRFWKFFLLAALYMFAVTLAVGCVWNLIAKDPVSTLFTTSALLHRVFDAIIAGLLISLLFVLIKRKNPN
jgi:hypothetical protein